jgi:mannose-6-phosphate isomerase-like protein (cupin superfamily)
MVFFTLPTVVGPDQGLDAPLGRLDTIHKVPGFVTEGRVAVVEHALPPGHLAAPLHRHSREDELSIVLEGRFGARLGDDVVEAGAGSYVLKPRGQWHTFWNAGVTPLRVIELLIPGECDVYLQRLSTMMGAGANGDTAAMRRLAAEYGIEIDFDSVRRLCADHGLTAG